MTNVLSTPVVLRGRITGLKVEDTTVDAFQSEMLRTKTGAAGALAAAVGMSGIAAGMVAMSMEEMYDNAFGTSFQIDGKQVKGVLWDHPFKEGDEVEVVAEPFDDHWNAFAVARPSDRTIALFPHVVSGRVAHYVTSFFLYLKVIAIMMLIGVFTLGLAVIMRGGAEFGVVIFAYLSGGLGASLLFAIIGIRVSLKYLPFVRIAESVFTALGWKDVKRINLRKRTFQQLKPGDDVALGVFHFRY